MKNIKYIIRRYDIYGDPPVGRLVGFLIKNEVNDKQEYVEILVTNEECENKSENDVCRFAFEKLKPRIETIKESLMTSPVVGSEFLNFD